MKKLIVLLIVALAMCAVLAGCGNRKLFDTTYNFGYAYISLPNGECVEGKVKAWVDYESGDEVQITIDGSTYLTHYSRVVMVAK